ncbi:MAG TPA: dihydrolipoamide acetyltransferase family protein [Hyphomicrobiaceae bacterium]|jgi:pyruvate dehydrogenase E2 component (dihydrolipoamide acetyltransferase)|nr:dihydrolipoamide acetyltransferase family protein [Hyphomicrobiaceae bacterium]
MDVLMPQLGETVAEGKITQWYKAPGDTVAPGDNLFEIETDKTSMEVPATAAGVLAEIRAKAGDVVPVGTVVAVISDGTGATASRAAPSAVPLPPPSAVAGPPRTASVPAPAMAAPAAANGAAPVRLDPFFEVRTPARNYGPARRGSVTVTPLARRLAAESGIDLDAVRGSGPHGRIFARDLATAAPRPLAARSPAVAAQQVKALYAPGSYEEVMLDNMRATIAARLVEAKQAIPHFYLTADVATDALIRLRADANAAAPKARDGTAAFKLSLNDIIVKAWAAALQRVPAANAVWAGDRILRLVHSDIGVAVAVEGGLYTPIVRRAETKTLSAISVEITDFSARARARRLKPQEYQGGSSVVSNLGMYGIREFAAIINPPHATVLAVGAARRQPIERPDGSVAFAGQMTVTLSCDHRVVDGALGAELLTAFRGFIENPVTALA